MKRFLKSLVVGGMALALLVPVAEAKRMGGGGNVGKQRSSSAMNEAPRSTPNAPAGNSQNAASSAAPASAAATGGAAAAAAKPSFMSRWGGLIAGVGMGALLGSMLGGGLGGLGSALGGILNVLLIVGAIWLVWRLIKSRRNPAPAGAGFGPQFATAGAGGAPTFRHEAQMPARAAAPSYVGGGGAEAGIPVPPGFEVEPFIRQSQSAFLRMQAANDAGDLADIRETTTPEVFAELAMQIRERNGASQRTEIVTIDARLLEVVEEGDHLVASLRYSGLVREAPEAPAEPFDEVWHLRRNRQPANAPWLVAGIQQMA